MVWNRFGSKEELHRNKMALIIAVEDANNLRKTEQAKIHDAIQLCKEILTIKTCQSKLLSEVESEDDPPTDTSPVVKEEIDLLEKALEKALRVRSGAEPSVTKTKTSKLPGNPSEHGATCAGAKPEVRDSKGHTKNKLLAKSFERKELRNKQTVNSRPCTKPADGFKSGQTKGPKIKILIKDSTVLPNGNVGSKKLPTFPGHGTLDHGQHTLPCGPKHQIMRSSQLSDKNIEAVSVSATNIIPSSKTKETAGNCLLQQKESIPSDELYKWTNLKSKQNRLWDKILAFETKSSVSGRDQFMERMRATFPTMWPCGSPKKTRALFHRLTQQGHNLSENRQTKELMARQTEEEDTELGGVENIQYSYLKLKNSRMTAKDIQKLADQDKGEWKLWDRWRPEWGCLCPTGANIEWQKELTAPLPMTVTYTTERELQELEKLRMRVALLQQETLLEKALSDTLSPHFSSVVHENFSPSLLRDFYSLLGEGGERFPAIVLDSEPDS